MFINAFLLLKLINKRVFITSMTVVVVIVTQHVKRQILTTVKPEHFHSNRLHRLTTEMNNVSCSDTTNI